MKTYSLNFNEQKMPFSLLKSFDFKQNVEVCGIHKLNSTSDSTQMKANQAELAMLCTA